MNHCRFQDNLSAYLDDELEADRRGTIETHLSTCDACRAEVEQYRAIRGAFESARDSHLAQVQWARLHQRVALAVRDQRLTEIRRTAESFAAMAAAVLLACFLWQGVWNSDATTTDNPLADAAWERTLVGGGVSEDTDEDLQLAQWIAYDLAPRSGGR